MVSVWRRCRKAQQTKARLGRSGPSREPKICTSSSSGSSSRDSWAGPREDAPATSLPLLHHLPVSSSGHSSPSPSSSCCCSCAFSSSSGLVSGSLLAPKLSSGIFYPTSSVAQFLYALPHHTPGWWQVAVSLISLEEPHGQSLAPKPPELLLLSSSLRTCSLPFGLNSSSTGESTDTSQVEVQESQTNGSLDSFINPTLPQIVIVPTSETALSEGQADLGNRQEENTDLFFSQGKNHLLDIGRLSSSTELLEAIETLLS